MKKLGLPCNSVCIPCAGEKNAAMLEKFKDCAELYCNLGADTFLHVGTSQKVWSPEDVQTLISARCEDNPPTFRNIAKELNRCQERIGDNSDREFNTRDCINKWARLFPTSLDANRAVEYCQHLRQKWPELFFETVTEAGPHSEAQAPKLLELHIVWPWSRSIMKSLSHSIFCDATFNVTVYDYKIVCISTLDGNNHHRPLMTSFIISSTGKQWTRIFNYFCRQVHDKPPPMYVVTSDQEKAIRSGLQMSNLQETSMQVICGLHTKWNVAAHK